jgi:orotate phosphoribosyltransferase-like protein
MDEDGGAMWICSDLRDADEELIDRALGLSKAGKSTREIADELSVSKSKADRLLQKAKRRNDTQAAKPDA